jgi:hypothetical protein
MVRTVCILGVCMDRKLEVCKGHRTRACRGRKLRVCMGHRWACKGHSRGVCKGCKRLDSSKRNSMGRDTCREEDTRLKLVLDEAHRNTLFLCVHSHHSRPSLVKKENLGTFCLWFSCCSEILPFQRICQPRVLTPTFPQPRLIWHWKGIRRTYQRIHELS